MEINISGTVSTKHTRRFDNYNLNWNPHTEYNLMFLRCQQNYFADKLRNQGHLFLNEMFDSLGFPRIPDGAVLGFKMPEAFGPIFTVREVDGIIFLDFEVEEIWNKI